MSSVTVSSCMSDPSPVIECHIRRRTRLFCGPMRRHTRSQHLVEIQMFFVGQQEVNQFTDIHVHLFLVGQYTGLTSS